MSEKSEEFKLPEEALRNLYYFNKGEKPIFIIGDTEYELSPIFPKFISSKLENALKANNNRYEIHVTKNEEINEYKDAFRIIKTLFSGKKNNYFNEEYKKYILELANEFDSDLLRNYFGGSHILYPIPNFETGKKFSFKINNEIILKCSYLKAALISQQAAENSSNKEYSLKISEGKYDKEAIKETLKDIYSLTGGNSLKITADNFKIIYYVTKEINCPSLKYICSKIDITNRIKKNPKDFTHYKTSLNKFKPIDLEPIIQNMPKEYGENIFEFLLQYIKLNEKSSCYLLTKLEKKILKRIPLGFPYELDIPKINFISRFAPRLSVENELILSNIDTITEDNFTKYVNKSNDSEFSLFCHTLYLSRNFRYKKKYKDYINKVENERRKNILLGIFYELSYDNTQPKNAYAIYRKEYGKNNTEAYIRLGRCYEYGIGIKRNPKYAYQCYSVDIDKNQNYMQTIMCSWRLLNGIGVEKDEEKAKNILQRSDYVSIPARYLNIWELEKEERQPNT